MRDTIGRVEREPRDRMSVALSDSPDLIDDDHACRRQHGRSIRGFVSLDTCLQELRHQRVVIAQHIEKRCRHSLYAEDQVLKTADIVRMLVVTYAAVEGHQLVCNVLGLVPGRIVQDEQLEVTVGLIQDTEYGALQELRSSESRDDGRDLGFVQTRLLRAARELQHGVVVGNKTILGNAILLRRASSPAQ